MSDTLGSSGNPLFVKMGGDGSTDWAREKTLKTIFDSLPKKWREANKPVADATQDAANATQANTKAQEQLPEQIKFKLQAVGQEWKKILSNGFSSGSGIFGTLGNSAQALGGSLTDSDSRFKKLGGTIEFTGRALAFFAVALDKLIQADKIFSEIYESGVRLQGGIDGLITSSNTARLSVQEFGTLAAKNSPVFAQLGGRDVPKLIKTFQDASRSGGEYLLSLQDGAEMFLQTVDIYQQAGIAGRVNNTQLVASSQSLISQFGKVSEATGLSRKALLDFVSSITKTGSSYLLLSTMSAEAGKNLIAATAQLAKFGQQGGKLLADNIQKYFAGSNTFGLLDESMQHLISTVPGLGGSFANLAEASKKGGEEYEDAQKQFARTLIAAPESLRRQLLMAMPELAGTLGELIKNAKSVEAAEAEKLLQMEAEAKRRGLTMDELKAERLEQAEADKKRKEVLNKLTDAFNNLNNEIFRAFASLGNFLTPGFEILIDIIKSVTTAFQDFDKWLSPGGQGGLIGPFIAAATAVGGLTLAVKGFKKIISMFSMPKGPPGFPGLGIGPGIPGSTPQNPIYTREVGAGGLGAGGAGGGAPGRPGQAGGSRVGRIGSMLGRGSIGGLVAGAALGGLSSAATGAGHEKTGAGLDILSQAAGLAGTGAMLGGFLGPGGMLLGGALGGLAGAGMGLYEHRETLFGGSAQRSPEQAAGQLSLLEQIDKMLEDRQGLNLQYSETGQALKDFSAGYREVISAVSLTPGAGGLDNLTRILSAVGGRAETPASAPAYQGMNPDWQTDTLTIWKDIRELNENMKAHLSSMKTSLETLITDRPVQGSGLGPGPP